MVENTIGLMRWLHYDCMETMQNHMGYEIEDEYDDDEE